MSSTIHEIALAARQASRANDNAADQQLASGAQAHRIQYCARPTESETETERIVSNQITQRNTSTLLISLTSVPVHVYSRQYEVGTMRMRTVCGQNSNKT